MSGRWNITLRADNKHSEESTIRMTFLFLQLYVSVQREYQWSVARYNILQWETNVKRSSVLKLFHVCVLLAWEIRLWLGLLPSGLFPQMRFVKKINNKNVSFCQPFFMNLFLLLLPLCWCSLFTKTTYHTCIKTHFLMHKHETWHIKAD